MIFLYACISVDCHVFQVPGEVLDLFLVPVPLADVASAASDEEAGVQMGSRLQTL